MKLENILKSASEILGVGEDNYAILSRCANLVLSSIATNYRDFVTCQVFNTVDGRIYYENFDKSFLRVKSVKVGGVDVSFSVYIGYIAVPEGRVEVEYCFVPTFSSMEEDIVVQGLSEQGFVYGVLAEYGFISGMFTEAKVWNEKFEHALFGGSRYKRVTLPVARW